MSSKDLFFSVCIPAYNRAEFLSPLLESILSQDFDSYEILICEDHSPQRHQIREIVDGHIATNPGKIRIRLNNVNLGYDGNIRELVAQAEGKYCFFMGNDDLMCASALKTAYERLSRLPDCSMAIRGYAWFHGSPENIKQEVRYYKNDHHVGKGAPAVVEFFRRCGVISGFIVKRSIAADAATSEFDGTLYYQMHLATHALINGNGLYIAERLVLSRSDIPPDFGNSKSERTSL